MELIFRSSYDMIGLVITLITLATAVPECKLNGKSVVQYLPDSKVVAQNGLNTYSVNLCSPLLEMQNGENGVAHIDGTYKVIANVETQKISYNAARSLNAQREIPPLTRRGVDISVHWRRV